MGYYAEGHGAISAKDKQSFDAIGAIMRSDTACLESTPFYDVLEYDIWNNDKYYGGEVLDFLNSLSEYINKGEIYYSGEDGSIWRFLFNPATSSWLEQSGIAVYDMSEFTDDQLRQELEKRGYSVNNVSLFDTLSE